MPTKTAIARETEADVSSYLGALNTAMKELSAIRKANKSTDAEIRAPAQLDAQEVEPHPGEPASC
ncbi:MAG: hypothetical protein HY043_24365 [Verrucomicrobia bacterium]|nr:hypothetical protein [Verrucomicrobiota bacterium]